MSIAPVPAVNVFLPPSAIILDAATPAVSDTADMAMKVSVSAVAPRVIFATLGAVSAMVAPALADVAIFVPLIEATAPVVLSVMLISGVIAAIWVHGPDGPGSEYQFLLVFSCTIEPFSSSSNVTLDVTVSTTPLTAICKPWVADCTNFHALP